MNAASERERVRAALAALGVRRLVLNVHELSFPSDETDDTGRGSPCSEAGLGFLRFLHGLGFDAVQLGPPGMGSEGSASPYDSAAFSRSPLAISLARLVRDEGPFGGLLSPGALAELVAARPEGGEARVPHGHVWRGHRHALGQAWETFRARRPERRAADAGIAARLAAFAARHAAWLEPDAHYELAGAPGEPDAVERYRFVQLLAHEQHAALRAELAGLGLGLYGDVHIGLSERDVRARAALFLPGYAMGAPPSRTNPEGQPWHYPVLDPAGRGTLAAPGPALRFALARFEKLLDEYDGLRLDHPHGWVCPWVYRTDDPDPSHAVQHGARLFSSPDLPDHPELARHAIVRRAQLNPDPTTPRHADDWEIALEPAQVERFAVVVDAIVASLRAHGRTSADLVCEVLSTLPCPLARVLERHGLGRFRVTQKADLRDPRDVYRSENARPEDWVMIGTHDTKPIWLLLEEWQAAGQLGERARYLAERLEPSPGEREAFARALVEEPGRLAQAQLADLFASPAENVMIFVADLLGWREVYNRPGVVSEENWSLRVPRDYAARYHGGRARLRALDLPGALALALRARGLTRADLSLG